MAAKKATSPPSYPQVKKSHAFSKLLEYTAKIHPVLDRQTEIIQQREALSEQIDSFQSALSGLPYLSLIMLWAASIHEDRVFGERYILMMTQLLENNVLPHRSLTIHQAASTNPEEIVSNIRCCNKWAIDTREDYVSLFCQFTSWAAEITFGYLAKFQDPDRQATMSRSLEYETYIKILKELSERDRILAKMFYLGGGRSLEEVLSLKIKDINFANNILRLSDEQVSYPRHVLEDIKAFIGGRKTGYVFLGRHGEKIDHTVPYRALKTVISKLGLDSSFTFKDFVKNS